MPIELYTANTPNSQRVVIVLEELALPYSHRKVDIFAGGAKTPEFLNVNPNGALPVIVDPDGPDSKPVTLTQSWLICLYLAEKTGKFLPKDPAKKAEALQWFMQVTTDVAPSSSAIFFMSNAAPDKTQANQQFLETRFVGLLKQCDQKLGTSKYLAGDDVTVADLALIPVV